MSAQVMLMRRLAIAQIVLAMCSFPINWAIVNNILTLAVGALVLATINGSGDPRNAIKALGTNSHISGLCIAVSLGQRAGVSCCCEPRR